MSDITIRQIFEAAGKWPQHLQEELGKSVSSADIPSACDGKIFSGAGSAAGAAASMARCIAAVCSQNNMYGSVNEGTEILRKATAGPMSVEWSRFAVSDANLFQHKKPLSWLQWQAARYAVIRFPGLCGQPPYVDAAPPVEVEAAEPVRQKIQSGCTGRRIGELVPIPILVTGAVLLVGIYQRIMVPSLIAVEMMLRSSPNSLADEIPTL